MPWPYAVTALAGLPDELGNSGLAIVGPHPPTAGAVPQTEQVFRHLGAVHAMNWTLIRHVPRVMMVLPWEMPSDATDVELYGESDCGEEIRLELLGPAGTHEVPGRKSRLCYKLGGWR